ncbi:MAG: hypothetical protein VYB76_01340 [Chloroflexota bacterium]|nr:hypothetical protein [Chloroflexota bacterium]
MSDKTWLFVEITIGSSILTSEEFLGKYLVGVLALFQILFLA